MADVLQTLSKLPPSAMLWENGQAYLIRRGVMGKFEYPLSSLLEVLLWNKQHKVTPEHVTAMDYGCTLGWDCSGADLKFNGGDTTFVFSAPLQVLLSVNANFEDDAAQLAEQSLNKLVEYMTDTVHDHVLSVLRDGQLDLLEENKHVTAT